MKSGLRPREIGPLAGDSVYGSIVDYSFQTYLGTAVGEPFMAPAERYVFAEMLRIPEHFTAGSHEWLPYGVFFAFPVQLQITTISCLLQTMLLDML